MNQKYGLVCNTIFSGQTMSAGDIYDTKEDAEAELLDMNTERVRQGMDVDEDFAVVPVFQNDQGGWEDAFGDKILVTGEPD